jgi:Sec-independent protein secretion pathway component TatC
LNTILPVSLDSFNSYGEKTLENIWSFDEVINLEVTLLTILLVLSQIPLGILFVLSNEKNLLQLPRIWRILTLLIIVISGILTPTIDGYTQLNFSISSFSFYIIIINLLQKRLLLKFRGYSILGF